MEIEELSEDVSLRLGKENSSWVGKGHLSCSDLALCVLKDSVSLGPISWGP